jgi:PHP family Zn ribbon phosphoesterase
MKEFLADLHIHSVLSPCGDLAMTPRTIVGAALNKGLAMIAITDHNSMRMCRIISDYAKEFGLLVIPGAEVNTVEEVHCLALFGDWELASNFQLFLDHQLKKIKNDPRIFGDQVVVDRDELILYTEKRSLITGLKAPISAIAEVVHRLGGLFIPAHIYRKQYGIIPTLGMLPENLMIDALEITPGCHSKEIGNSHEIDSNVTRIFNSDAHFPDQIGNFSTRLWMEEPSFDELRLALRNLEGRAVIGLNHKQL